MPDVRTLQLVVSAYLVGLIWLIQLIHYPSFTSISAERWNFFHQAHTAAMGLLAGGPMVIALLLGLWLAWRTGGPLQYTALACELAAWIVTFAISVPLHQRLAAGPDPQAIALLISTNWLRTAAWTVKLGVLLMQRPVS